MSQDEQSSDATEALDVLEGLLAEHQKSEAGRELLAAILAAGKSSAIDPSALAGGFQSSSNEELQALANVAARYKGCELSIDPIAVDMVAAVLSVRFGAAVALADDAGRPAAIAYSVARSIWDDPIAANRLQRLWARLSSD